MKLSARLPLFFCIVIAVTSLTTLLLVRNSTEVMFRSFVFSGDSEKALVYASLLGEYWQENKSWDGAQTFLNEMPSLVSRMINTQIHGTSTISPYPVSQLRILMADRVVLADIDGMIVADTASTLLHSVHSSVHLAEGLPVVAASERRGTVLVGSMIDSSLTGIAERFLQSITNALLFATLISSISALILGIIFASGITKPLRSLVKAASRVASGDLTTPVPVRGNDELSELSTTFNQMTSELMRLDEAKKQVIADSAHELRTPVTLVRGLIEGMIDGILPCDIATLGSVHEETLRLSRLIDTLRELEIIESGALILEDVDIAETIRRAILMFDSTAREKGITLDFSVSDTESPIIRGDSLRLGEVIYNLLSNAIKYTPPGGSVKVQCGTENGNIVWFSVSDTGPGIPEAERERIFERFYRIDKSRATDSGGRGLGLAIASEIVKAHGGSINVSSAISGGACFTVRLNPLPKIT